MGENYFKLAWRHFRRNKAWSFINIIGLATGMGVVLLIALWIGDELSFDHYHRNHGRLAEVMDTQTFSGETLTSEAIPIPLAAELRDRYGADLTRVALVYPNFTHALTVGDRQLSASGVWTWPDLPEMLTLKMIRGRRDALKDPSSALIEQSLATALFGNTDPMGRIIRIDNMTEVKVAGVFEDLPQNTSFYGTRIFLAWDKGVSAMPWLKDYTTKWDVHYWKLFVQVKEGIDMDRATARIRYIPRQHVKDGDEEILLHPMDKAHLYSEFVNGRAAGGRVRYVWLFGIIGMFVLVIACINFMNLSTARSERRAREVGIRKVIGSRRGQLIGQFFSESLLMALLAFLLALGMVLAALPFFNRLTGKEMAVPWTSPVYWLFILGFTLSTGLVAGSYPALYLSAFRPVKVLKGPVHAGRWAALPRKILVVLQFTVSVSLIIGTLVVYRQIQYAKDRPVGYTREGLITVTMSTADIYGASYNGMREALLETGAVEDMGKSSVLATEEPGKDRGFDWAGKDPAFTAQLELIGVTHDYGRTLGWQLREGRDFSRSFATDTGAVILNETAAALTGFRHPVGETIRWEKKAHPIIGIVKDMVMESPYKPVQPCIFFLNYNWGNYITLRIKRTMPAREALGKIGAVFRRINPGGPFDYRFIDEVYARKFSDEELIGHLATMFSLVAILISCLGLFGLASYTAEQRTREIGVRKVLGASVWQLWTLLSREFLALVILSCCMAIPIAWYFLHRWLQEYAYRTGLPGWVFVSAGIGASVITLLTVSWQAIRAARVNPVRSLRAE